MSEDAPVNTGAAVVWPDDYSAALAVRRMQTKLHRWAGKDSSRRFDDLFNLVYDPAFLDGAASAGAYAASAPLLCALGDPTQPSSGAMPIHPRRVVVCEISPWVRPSIARSGARPTAGAVGPAPAGCSCRTPTAPDDCPTGSSRPVVTGAVPCNKRGAKLGFGARGSLWICGG